MAEEPRLSGPTLKLLRLYLQAPREVFSGADITKRTGIGAGTLYPLLGRLKEHGWLEAEWETVDPRAAGRPRRRFYRLTALGQTKANAALAEFQMPVGAVAWAS